MNTSFANLSPFFHRLQLSAFRRFFSIGRASSNLQREREVLKMVSRRTEKHEALALQWAEIAEKRPMRVQNFFRQLIAAGTYRIAKQAPAVPIVVLNSLADQMVDPRCSEKLARYWDLPLISHPTAGHDICIDDPDWVIEKIKEQWGPSKKAL